MILDELNCLSLTQLSTWRHQVACVIWSSSPHNIHWALNVNLGNLGRYRVIEPMETL